MESITVLLVDESLIIEIVLLSVDLIYLLLVSVVKDLGILLSIENCVKLKWNQAA